MKETDFEDYLEAEVVDQDGKLVGTLECYWTGAKGDARMLGVRTRRATNRISMVPVVLADANERQSCVVLRLPSASLAKAPDLDCDQPLSPALEQRVYAFFELDQPEQEENVRIHRAEHTRRAS